MSYYAPFYRQQGYYYPTQQNAFEGQNISSTAIPQFQNQYQQQPQADMVWVLNETEAMAYPVAPNTTVTLWDKSSPVTYIKSANAQGVPSIRILDYKERINAEPSKTLSDELSNLDDKFVKKEDIIDLRGKIEGLQNELESLKEKTKAKVAKISSKDQPKEE